MQSIVVISDKSKIIDVFSFNSLAGIRKKYTIKNRYVVEFEEETYISITHDNDIFHEYEENELAKIPINKRNFFLVEYNNFSVFKNVLKSIIKPDSKSWIDIEDKIYNIDVVLKKLHSDVEWDWRLRDQSIE